MLCHLFFVFAQLQQSRVVVVQLILVLVCAERVRWVSCEIGCIQYQKGISTALEELRLVKRMQRQREEIESLCSEVLKRPCLKETRQLENAQVERRERAERAVREARSAIARKKQLVEAAIEAAKDLFQETGGKS